MDDIRLLLIADDPLARGGLAMLLNGVEEIDLVGQIDSQTLLADVEAELDGYEPDLLLWDLGWSSGETLPAFDELDLPVVLLVGEETAVTHLWHNQQRTLLSRDVSPDKLLAAAQAALAELVILDPALADQLLPPQDPTLSDQAVEPLTPREEEVLRWLAEGLTNKAIASRLSISNHTVKFHVNALMTKLNAQSRTDAVVRATRLGLLLL